MRDIDRIEQRVAASRTRLATSLDELTETVAPRTVADQVAGIAEAYGGEIGRQAWTAARQNPAAFALVGAGLGLLLTGTGARDETRTPTPTAVPPQQAFDGFDARMAAADTRIKQEMTGMTQDTRRAERMRATLERGLDALPDAARKRVVKARMAALEAQQKVEDRASRAAATTRTFHHQQPLAVGALALGMGALIGALLPSTRREDELLGRERDALMRKAQAALQDEMDRIATSATSTLRAAQSPHASQSRAG